MAGHREKHTMTDTVLNKETSLSGEEVISRAVQFFSSESWKPTGQSTRTATFEGRVPIPWVSLALTILGFMFCIIPGIIFYFLTIKKLRRFQNLVVAVGPANRGTSVTVTVPSEGKKLASRFLESLPET